MEAFKEASKTPVLGTAAANSQQRRTLEHPAWVGVVVILALSAFSFYLLWAKTTRGV